MPKTHDIFKELQDTQAAIAQVNKFMDVCLDNYKDHKTKLGKILKKLTKVRSELEVLESEFRKHI